MAKTVTLSGKIISFIKSRAAIVTTIFTLFGYALQKLLLKINDTLLGEFGAIFALLFAFITCMVFSLILKGDYKSRSDKKFRIFKKRLNTGIVVSGIGLVCLGFLYFYLVNSRTISYKAFDQPTRVLKGEYKQELPIAAIKDSIIRHNYPVKSVTEEALMREVGGSSEALYTAESLVQTRFLLLVVYCLFIIFFTAVSYIVPDIVTVYYSDIEDGKTIGDSL
jgi:hypothetical protein